MVVSIGQKPLAGFGQPIEMMKDCHRRIEHFLDVLRRVEAQFGDRDLNEDARRALVTAVDYFANSAPRHTEDEEDSLFPRMRETHAAQFYEVFSAIAHLESDHQQADVCHEQLDMLVRDWIARGRLRKTQRVKIRLLLKTLTELYEEHIRTEESHVFPIAEELLAPEQLAEIGSEMQRRRGLLQH